MKVLNLYAGLGGNRRLWKDCEVTAVEYNEQIADVYKTLYPKDTMVVGDAHAYLLEHFKEFDYIWSSPPCQTHSSLRFNLGVRFRGTKAAYPDFRLYEEIMLLKMNEHHAKWCVENVRPYYKPLIEPTVELQRHLFWSNYDIQPRKFKTDKIHSAQIPELQRIHGIDLSGTKLKDKRQCLRNCVLSELGLYLFEEAFKGDGYEKTKV